MPVDISGCEKHIPEKYFVPNVNYENDPATIVQQMQFPSDFKKVPLDFALCRYLSCERGLTFMPLSNFCMHESEHKVQNFVRVAICRPKETYESDEMVQKITAL